MSRILVEVRVPASQRRYDLLVPYEVRVQGITELMQSLVADEAEWGFQPTPDTRLYFAASGEEIDPSKSPRDCGLKNGSRLLLM